MGFRLVLNSVTSNNLERRNSQSPRNFTEFGSFQDGHDMEVFVYILISSQCRQKYYIDVRSYDGDICFCEEFNSTYLRPLNVSYYIYLLTFRQPRFRSEKPILKIPTHPHLYTWVYCEKEQSDAFDTLSVSVNCVDGL